MAIPKTYLLQAPPGVKGGRAIAAADLIRGLRELNPRINAWMRFPEYHWWPGRGEVVVTTLWLGDPGGTSRKLTAFTLGEVPEFTELEAGGKAIRRKGWRAIFDKVIRAGAASKEAVELKFGVRLDYDLAPETTMCRVCHRVGKEKPHNGGAARLCGFHDTIREALAPELDEMRRLGRLGRN